MGLLTAKLLLTFVTLGYSLIPAIFDMNATHATNPIWAPHARFHVVWQVVSYVCVAAIALVLIWAPGQLPIERLWLAAALATAAYTGFFAAVFTVAWYGGAHYDVNGVLPYRPPVIGSRMAFEVNITIFTTMAIVLTAGIACLAIASAG